MLQLDVQSQFRPAQCHITDNSPSRVLIFACSKRGSTWAYWIKTMVYGGLADRSYSALMRRSLLAADGLLASKISETGMSNWRF